MKITTEPKTRSASPQVLGSRDIQTLNGGVITYDLAIELGTGDILVLNSSATSLCHRVHVMSIVEDVVEYEKNGIVFSEEVSNE